MEKQQIDLTQYHNVYNRKHQIIRLIWGVVWPLGTWFLPMSLGLGWKRFLLRLFGAHIHPTAKVYSSARIFYPANLYMEKNSCIGAEVRVLNVAPVYLGEQSTISEKAYICAGSHDITDVHNAQIVSPIHIGAQVWIAVEAFVGMGVTIGEGSVVGARAAVFKDVEPWTVVGGNPAKSIKKRVIKD